MPKLADASRGSQQLPVESKIMKALFEPVPILGEKTKMLPDNQSWVALM
jgi:hypothetical protein